MAEDDGGEADLEEFSLSVRIGVFVLATVASAGSILLLGKFAPTPPGAVEGAIGRFMKWIGIAVAALLIVEGLDFASTYIDKIAPIEVGQHTGRSTVFSITAGSMILVAAWNVVVLLVSPIGIAVVPYETPQYMVWTLATTMSLKIILTVGALAVIVAVFLLVLRLLFDIGLSGMDVLSGDDGVK